MENQHREIKGYRELNETEIALMNCVKEAGAHLGTIVDSLRADKDLDQRWVSIGATDLQTGLMALTRAIAKPTFFLWMLCAVLLTGCSQAKSYQMGDLQVEVLDRPAALSQSLVVVGWCERVFLNNDGHCRSDKMNDMQVFVQTGFVTSLMGPVIQAGGMIGAGALIGDGLSKSGSSVSQNSQSSQANLNAVNQTNGRGPWRHGYR